MFPYTTNVKKHSFYEQHSISIFAVNLEVTDKRSSLLDQITLTWSVHISKDLFIFGDNVANQRQQISGILSGVTMLSADNN